MSVLFLAEFVCKFQAVVICWVSLVIPQIYRHFCVGVNYARRKQRVSLEYTKYIPRITQSISLELHEVYPQNYTKYIPRITQSISLELHKVYPQNYTKYIPRITQSITPELQLQERILATNGRQSTDEQRMKREDLLKQFKQKPIERDFQIQNHVDAACRRNVKNQTYFAVKKITNLVGQGPVQIRLDQ